MQGQRIDALPHFGIYKHGPKLWYLVEMESGATLGLPHKTKVEALAYAYERNRNW